MMETFDSLEGKKLKLSENVQNLRNVLDICKGCPEFSNLLVLEDEERLKGDASISGKLRNLGEEYQRIFDFYNEKDPNNKKDFNELYKNLQSFLVELAKIFDEKVKPEGKWKNKMLDWFVREMFKLDSSFYELNRGINDQKDVAFSLSHWMHEDDYSTKFNVAEMYNTVVKDFDLIKEDNKRLGIMVYYSLLKLMDEEFIKLLGKSDENKIPTEKEFGELSKNLFILDFINVKTYKDFCNKYAILKNKQRDLLDMKGLINEYFDEEKELKSDADLKKLHMKNLKSFLNVSLRDITEQKIARIFGKRKTN